MTKISYDEYISKKKSRDKFYRINFIILIVLGIALLIFAQQTVDSIVNAYMSMFSLFILVVLLCFDKIKELENRIDSQNIDYQTELKDL